ncbi:MAG: ArsR family transcriptional regulator [Nanoarchaeota archaeon]|nr:ArsR family transcriptional regulator [Nanoarchaeota archaeon]
MNIRKFHINELPQDRIFAYLEEDFHKKLFLKIKEYKFKEFNELFFNNKLKWATFKQWRSMRHFIPLWFIVGLSGKFSEFSLEDFEKHIVAMKGPSTSNLIENPSLPLPEDSRLLKITGHFLGDGHVGGGFGNGLPNGKTHSEYRNFNSTLLDSFGKDLQVFGAIKVSKDYKHGHVIVPNIIGYILEHVYNIKFDCFNSRVPKRLFELPREFVASFLRAFGDDEGHVYDSSIEYYSSNMELLTDVLNLMNGKFPEIKTSTIKVNTKAGKNTKYSFMIYNGSVKRYSDLIGFDHPEKTEDLIYNINRKRTRINNCRDKILNLLKERNLTAKQISRSLGKAHCTILTHLKILRDLGKVEIVIKVRWANVWRLLISEQKD